MAARARAGPVGPHMGSGTKELNYPLLLSQVYWQEAKWEVEKHGLKLAPTREPQTEA